jgi:hypothetical protein
MSFFSKMTPSMSELLCKILDYNIPDWDSLSKQANEAMKPDTTIAKAYWGETDSFRKPKKGKIHDIWKIEDGICLKRRPSFLAKIFAFFLKFLDLLFAPLRFIQWIMEKFIFALSSKLRMIGGIISLPFALFLSFIDFFRDYIRDLIGLIFSPFAFIAKLISLPYWLINNLISRIVEVFLTAFLAKVFSQFEKKQQLMIDLLAKNGWLRNILLGMLRHERPGLPIVIPKKCISEVFVKEKLGKKYFCVVEGDKLKTGFVEFIFLKIKQNILPYYWERTVHMFLIPKEEADQVQAKLEEALAR